MAARVRVAARCKILAQPLSPSTMPATTVSPLWEHTWLANAMCQAVLQVHGAVASLDTRGLVTSALPHRLQRRAVMEPWWWISSRRRPRYVSAQPWSADVDSGTCTPKSNLALCSSIRRKFLDVTPWLRIQLKHVVVFGGNLGMNLLMQLQLWKDFRHERAVQVGPARATHSNSCHFIRTSKLNRLEDEFSCALSVVRRVFFLVTHSVAFVFFPRCGSPHFACCCYSLCFFSIVRAGNQRSLAPAVTAVDDTAECSTYIHRTKRTSLPAHDLSSWIHSNLLVKTLSFYFNPKYFRSLLCACAALTFLILCDWRCAIALCICNGSTRTGRSLCVHTALRGFVVSQVVNDSQRLADEKRPSHADRRNARSMMSCSYPALLSFPSDKFYGMMETTNPRAMHMESVRRENPVQMHQEDMKTLSWEWNLGN